MSDVVAESVAAYSDHVEAYIEANADKMAEERQRFADGMIGYGAILDAGCGPGRDLHWFNGHGFDAVGVDLNPDFVIEAQDIGRACVADLRDLPFPSETFDGIWACASLVHLPHDDTHLALEELSRVSKPRARFYASVKADGETGWRDTAHGRRWFKTWTLDEFSEAVASEGFTVTSSEVDGAFINVRGVTSHDSYPRWNPAPPEGGYTAEDFS